MKLFFREISGLWVAQRELRKLGADSAGIGIMAKKIVGRVFVVRDMDIRAANILKQECLAIGAELALPKEASMLRGESTDAILIGTVAQLDKLIMNLRAQPFGLKVFGEELSVAMRRVQAVSECARPEVMAVLNVTPDSFSQIDVSLSDSESVFEGGKVSAEKVTRIIERLVDEGADWIDVGGESTGPGSVDVSVAEELARVEPVLEVVRRGKWSERVRFSIDTYKSRVAEKAIIDAGFSLVNDVTAMRGDSEMAVVVARSGANVVLMYSKDSSARTTREAVQYDDVVATIGDFFEARLAYGEACGIAREKIVLDPGMGAFVSGEARYSFEILDRLGEFKVFGLPVLVGTSRKSFLGGDIKNRLEASLATSVVAYLNGAKILRVHDVGAARKALDSAYSTVSARSVS